MTKNVEGFTSHFNVYRENSKSLGYFQVKVKTETFVSIRSLLFFPSIPKILKDIMLIVDLLSISTLDIDFSTIGLPPQIFFG